ncbi:MAG TPA: GNAT family N-acetyltransferase [Rhizomicrobium sp.]|nr:GNAT family N-acetyltransferase [Rhizomicrobium sp.]
MIRDATRADFPAILALNADWVEFLSPMDAAELTAFARASRHFRVAEEGGAVAAFLLAFRAGDAYGGAVFARFMREGGDFFYIDRIVVDERCRNLGLARALYDDLETAARAAGVPRLVCEVNADPPNDASLRFHLRYGFAETGLMPHNGKRVALMEKLLAG